jgi:uncharacterized protein
MPQDATKATFTAALDALVEQVKLDRSVLAAILCGSLSHDTVWARSDIDLMLVTADDKQAKTSDVALDANGVNVHAFLVPRAEFRKTVESAIGNSFVHALLAKGRLLYTHDDSIAELCARLQDIGARDVELQLLRAASSALACLAKARKWLVTRGDLDYTALWILYAATPLAQLEVMSARRLADREVIPQALALNPEFFAIVYSRLFNEPKTRPAVEAALDAADGYLAERAPKIFRPILDYLREAGEARSASEIENHFTRHLGAGGVTTACEYLAEQGLVGRASTAVRLTRRSNVDVQELAFYALAPGRGGAR